jgi:hypothetical protein
MFGKKAKRIVALEARVRELERLSPTGVAGIGGLAIADYFEQWEQTGHDPHTQIPVIDMGVIEKSAITHAIHTVAIAMLKDKKAIEIIRYVYGLNPELVAQQLQRIPIDALAEAIVKNIEPTVIHTWVQTNGNIDDLIQKLKELSEHKDPFMLIQEQLSQDGTVDLLSLPEGSAIALYFYNNRGYHGLHQDPFKDNRRSIISNSSYFNSYVQVIVTRNTDDELYLRMNKAQLATQKELRLQFPITVEADGFNHNEIVLGHKYSGIQHDPKGNMHYYMLGKLVNIAVCNTKD